MHRKTALTMLLFCLFAMPKFHAGEEDVSGRLFAVDFDAHSTRARFAKGNPDCTSFESQNLHLRMFNGVSQGGIGLANSECCAYDLDGNFDSRKGTVSFWVAPQTWAPSEKKFQIFFEAVAKGYQLTVYKYFQPQRHEKQEYHCLYFRLQCLSLREEPWVCYAVLDDKEWRRERWHKLDATWDNSCLQLFVDGKQVPNEPWPNRGLVKFEEGASLPLQQGGTITWGTPNGWRKNEFVDQADSTGFDELAVYDRVLSAGEILQAYNKFNSAAEPKAENAVTIPQLPTAPEIDGKPGTEEWKQAARLPVAQFMAEALPCRVAWALACHDGKNLYLAFDIETERPPLANMTERDGKVYSDDSVEFFLQSPAGADTMQLIVNANGALFDALNRDTSWNIGARVAAAKTETGWSCELALPLAELPGGVAPGQSCKGNFYATYHEPDGRNCFSGWSRPHRERGYAESEIWGLLKFGVDAKTARVEEFALQSDGGMKLRLSGGETEMRIVSDQRKVPVADKLASGAEWAGCLEAGKNILALTVPGEGAPLMSYNHTFYINRPLEVEYACRPRHARIDVTADISCAGSEVMRRLAAGELSVSVSLRDGDGKELSRNGAALAERKGTVAVPLPENLAQGVYQVVAEIMSGEEKLLFASRPLRVPDMTPYRQPVASDREVPAPWVPIVRDAYKLSVLGRTYTFDAGPFPSSIRAHDGVEILQAQPEFLVDFGQGETGFVWNQPEFVEVAEDAVVLRGTGAPVGNDTLKTEWEGTLFFDGVWTVKVNLIPVGEPVDVKSLRWRAAVPEACGKFVLTPRFTPWGGYAADRIELPFRTLTDSIADNSVWLTGRRHGLFWYPQSDKNWTIADAKNDKVFKLVRKDDCTILTAEIITRPVKFEQAIDYAMTLMASPARPAPQNHRSFRMGAWGTYKNENYTTLNWGGLDKRYELPDTMTDGSSLVPVHPERFGKLVEQIAKNGSGSLPYSQPTYIGSDCAEADYFYHDWEHVGSRVFAYEPKTQPRYKMLPVLGVRGWCDLMAWRVNDMLEKYPGLGGIYFDLSTPAYSANEDLGHSGIDAFGRRYRTGTAFLLRDFMLRIYKVTQRHGKIVVHHNQCYFNPIAHNFMDYWVPGEEYADDLPKGWEHFYCEALRPEVYQVEESPYIRGVGVSWIPQYLRSASFYKDMPKEELEKEEYAFRLMTPLMLHDIQMWPTFLNRAPMEKVWGIQKKFNVDAAEFKGYWEQAEAMSFSKGIRCSYYVWPGQKRILLMAGNFERGAQPLALRLDLKALGAERKITLRDEYADAEMTPEELLTREIPGNHFNLISLSWE
jgi:hypothetical protein